uniref:Uncharacterized protein n=1 Tax=Manihot esculenta TaxID=3983 RepID=A0A2C9WEB0_MANES
MSCFSLCLESLFWISNFCNGYLEILGDWLSRLFLLSNGELAWPEVAAAHEEFLSSSYCCSQGYSGLDFGLVCVRTLDLFCIWVLLYYLYLQLFL